METDIQKFFKNKKIFLTGGTGFLGKVFMEKLLRCTDVERIYVMVRPKKGKDMNSRIEEIFQDPLFEKLKELKPSPQNYVKPMAGDCAMPFLGLSEYDRNEIISNVDIIMHGAATVLFNEPLNYALDVNVRATMDLINLAKRVKNLQAFVHVSSAFANCFEFHIEEDLYTDQIGITAEKACILANVLGPEETSRLATELIKKFPNTYTFTKALAEEAIFKNAQDLPVCIFRPGIVTGTYAEPLEGWIDNLYGPSGIIRNAAHGLIRVKYLQSDYNANIVPVDFCANMMIVLAWKTSLQVKEGRESIVPPIYNFVPETENMLKWKIYKETIEKKCAEIPFSYMVWYPIFICTKYKLVFNILSFLCHIIPAYLFDFCFMLTGKPKKLVKANEKIQKATAMLDYFVENQWTFSTKNTRALWNSLPLEEQKLFNFDMLSIDWDKYYYHTLAGARLYLSKDDPSTIPAAKKLYKRLKFLHHTFRAFLFGGITSMLLLVIYIFVDY